MYSDSDNGNKVSSWAKVRNAVPQAILAPLLFILCINHLPKILNKTAAPFFADDASYLLTLI
jgi:hypothetical protein